MSDRVMIRWANMTEKTAHLIPWWVGPWAVRKGSRLHYWRPVEDTVNEWANHDAGIATWLGAAGREYVLVELGRAGLQLFQPRRTTKFDDGGVSHELEIPDGIAHSRDLDEVQDFLLERTMAALGAIAKKLRTAPPTHTAGDRADLPRGRLADIAMKHGGGRPLVLLSPRYRHRPLFDQLEAALAADETDTGSGWGTCSVNPDPAHRTSVDTEFDFTGIVRPLDPDLLLRDPRHVCLLVAAAGQPLPAQREQLEACAALVNDHLPVRANVVGNDGGVLWAALVVHSPRAG